MKTIAAILMILCAGWLFPLDVSAAPAQTSAICGLVWHCCMTVRPFKAKGWSIKNVPICPAQRGYSATRHGAFSAWATQAVAIVVTSGSPKDITELNCHDKAIPISGICGNYPAP